MYWSMTCGDLSLRIDDKDRISYDCTEVIHRCPEAIFGSFPTARLRKTVGGLGIYPHGLGYVGGLNFISSKVSAPIVAAIDEPRVVALYGDPGKENPEGGMLFTVLLPTARFEALGKRIDAAMHSGRISMALAFEFHGFRELPANWDENQIPTESQFFGPPFTDRYPIVSSKVSFTFFPKEPAPH